MQINGINSWSYVRRKPSPLSVQTIYSQGVELCSVVSQQSLAQISAVRQLLKELLDISSIAIHPYLCCDGAGITSSGSFIALMDFLDFLYLLFLVLPFSDTVTSLPSFHSILQALQAMNLSLQSFLLDCVVAGLSPSPWLSLKHCVMLLMSLHVPHL